MYALPYNLPLRKAVISLGTANFEGLCEFLNELKEKPTAQLRI